MEAERRRILDRFQESGVDFLEYEHKAVRTSEQAAKVRGVPLRSGVKALVCKTQDKRFIIVLVRADKKADLEKVARSVGTERISLAKEREVVSVTGCVPGSVPPFGHKEALETYADGAIFKEERVNFNVGLKTKSVEITGKELKRVLGEYKEF